MRPSRISLIADQRGGVENVLYIMLVALIAIVAIPGVRMFTASAERSFQSSTSRFDRPGTYSGGEVEFGPSRTRDWGLQVGSQPSTPTPTSNLSDWWYDLGINAAEWLSGFLSGDDARPDYDQAGAIDIIHPDGRIEEDVPLEQVLERVRRGEIDAGGVNGALNSRDSARENYLARAEQTGQAQVLIYYPQGVDLTRGTEYRDQVHTTVDQISDAAGESNSPFAWTCHSHSCHFVADAVSDSEGQTLDAYAPTHLPAGNQRDLWEDSLNTSEMDRITIYRGSDDWLSNGLATDADEIRDNDNVNGVVVEGTGHAFQDLLDNQPQPQPQPQPPPAG